MLQLSAQASPCVLPCVCRNWRCEVQVAEGEHYRSIQCLPTAQQALKAAAGTVLKQVYAQYPDLGPVQALRKAAEWVARDRQPEQIQEGRGDGAAAGDAEMQDVQGAGGPASQPDSDDEEEEGELPSEEA